MLCTAEQKHPITPGGGCGGSAVKCFRRNRGWAVGTGRFLTTHCVEASVQAGTRILLGYVHQANSRRFSDFKTKLLKCSGDQISSGGHSGEERVETNQIIAANPDFHEMAARFLCDDREMESDLP
jgi:hypothetical protein